VLTGCSSVTFNSSTGSASSPKPGSPQFKLRGSLVGGRKPISGSTVSLVEAGASGKASSTVLATTITDSHGDFSLPEPNCRYPDSQLYLTASGGDAGNRPTQTSSLTRWWVRAKLYPTVRLSVSFRPLPQRTHSTGSSMSRMSRCSERTGRRERTSISGSATPAHCFRPILCSYRKVFLQ